METTGTKHTTVALLSRETPLHPLKRLGTALDIDLWIKRDDLGEIGGGGNKLRKLEHILGVAVDSGHDVLLTAGSVQSNHCRLTASAATRLGMDCHLVLTLPFDGPDPAYLRSGNRALFDLFGAEITILRPGEDSGAPLARLAADLKSRGRDPLVIPIGGSSPRGCLGYIDAAGEIAGQLTRRNHGPFDLTVCASGSGGMQAGLIMGNARHAFSKRIVGMSVGRGQGEQTEIVRRLVEETQLLLDPAPARGAVEVSDRARGPGYGRLDAGTMHALSMAARLEGLLLDPVYTAKACAGLLAMAADGTIAKGSRVLFIHSGGWPALYAYPETLSKGDGHAP